MDIITGSYTIKEFKEKILPICMDISKELPASFEVIFHAKALIVISEKKYLCTRLTHPIYNESKCITIEEYKG